MKRKTHNKNKTLVRYIGFSRYENKNYKSRNVLSTLRAFTGILALTSLCMVYGNYNVEQDLINPLISINEVEVQAKEPESTPNETVSEPPTIEEYIRQTYPENPDKMVELFTCESGLNPETIGDKHLMGMLDGEMIGDSVGIAQIRTGNAAGSYDNSNWNRAKANGYTVAEFRELLKDPYYNIDYSRDIYDRQGIYAWTNCARKVGLIK